VDKGKRRIVNSSTGEFRFFFVLGRSVFIFSSSRAARQLPVVQAPPAHPRSVPEFWREHLPGNAAAKDEDNAGQTRAIRDAWPSTFWPRGGIGKNGWTRSHNASGSSVALIPRSRYLADEDQASEVLLLALRSLIKETVPGVEERISYGTTVMFALGRDLVGFVSQPKHLSFFTASPELARAMKEQISKTHTVSGATIHFSPDNPLPAGLVKKILSARVPCSRPGK
jgi:uncharacterized protein YdhG (YjbR/CyaY superfamily)